ncbi:taste receptor type 2 member 40-like [Sphaerodactylus townsendi]|uniref:taste receptor type 2 member 40-like n=1 Tax=Sphaerodactylus townsendi TaxID=933632 RepID=UPI00202602F1|nr:taste receptor type 2 member 40-like [Sphaerodactylus townsendi]
METSGCSVPTSADSLLSSISFMVFSVLQAVIGMALNAFIVTVSCVNRMKRRQLKCTDKILIALGISRFCYLCVLLGKILWMSVSSRAVEVTSAFQMVRGAIWFLSCVCFWFSACQCLFCCVKIANFRHCLFVHLKMGISRLVPWMLLVSVIGSLINTCPFLSGIYNITCRNNTGSNISGNQTHLEDLALETNLFNLFLFCGVGFSAAFSVSAASSSLLLFSLWRHTHLMRNGSTGFSHPSMAAHFQAVKTITSLLIVDSFNFVGLMLLLSNLFAERTPENQIITTVIFVCPSVQSQIMIWGNPQLKKAFIRAADGIRHMFSV